MANPQKFYLGHMNSKTGYRATWDPGRPLKIGYIGKLDSSGVFTVFSSLDKEGIPMEVLTDDSEAEMDYTSHDSVSIAIKASGSAPAAGSVFTDAEAGFTFEFKSDRGVVFQTSGHKTHQLVNVGEIEKQVIQKYNDDNWEKEWLIVTQLVEAATATVIISNSSNAKLELKASANAGLPNLKLTDASLGLTVAREQGSTLKYITQNGLTPLYRVMGIRHPFLGSPHLDTKGDGTDAPKEIFQIQDFSAGELGE